jgi:hypothetical protein
MTYQIEMADVLFSLPVLLLLSLWMPKMKYVHNTARYWIVLKSYKGIYNTITGAGWSYPPDRNFFRSFLKLSVDWYNLDKTLVFMNLIFINCEVHIGSIAFQTFSRRLKNSTLSGCIALSGLRTTGPRTLVRLYSLRTVECYGQII